ncbi:hypothetical protein ABZ922_24725 [Streptomyces shenzhenensis]
MSASATASSTGAARRSPHLEVADGVVLAVRYEATVLVRVLNEWL